MPLPDDARAQSRFPVTQWTAVVQVCQAEDEALRRRALAEICQAYWYPLYAFARRAGHSQADAEDFTQGFFSYLVEHNLMAAANRELGRLRTFLLAVFQRCIRDVETHRQALKRGGGQMFVSLDLLNAEEHYRHEPADPVTPETLFERAWALQVLRGAIAALRAAETGEGRGRAFDVLSPFLDPESTAGASTEAAARELGISVEGVRQAVSRLRRRFRETLRRQIAATLRDPDDVQINGELTALQAALRS
ncbi:MAG: RNA polymerase subunit sigma-24 [Verrucomicrobiota bacterium]